MRWTSFLQQLIRCVQRSFSCGVSCCSCSPAFAFRVQVLPAEELHRTTQQERLVGCDGAKSAWKPCWRNDTWTCHVHLETVSNHGFFGGISHLIGLWLLWFYLRQPRFCSYVWVDPATGLQQWLQVMFTTGVPRVRRAVPRGSFQLTDILRALVQWRVFTYMYQYFYINRYINISILVAIPWKTKLLNKRATATADIYTQIKKKTSRP